MDTNEETTTQHIEYTRTVVPSTMRSPYWKYFGFPSDSSNNVLTKQKIVCSLCSAVIAYNKNTSNLRTHIVARHQELLVELFNEKHKKNNEVASASVLQSKNRSEPPAKRQKTHFIVTSSDTKGNVSYVPTPVEPGTSELKQYTEAIIEVNEPEPDDKNIDTNDYDEYSGSNLQTAEYTFEDIEENTLRIQKPLENNLNQEEDLLEMLITDLQPPSTVEEPGFTKFAVNLGAHRDLFRKHYVEKQINKLHSKHFKKVHQQLKTITNTMPYSLCMESFQNIEGKSMMCIYFNHLVPTEARLQYTAYTTIEASENTDYDSIFSEFNLSNCTAALLSEENDVHEQFFAAHGIPILPCFETVIHNCMISIFAHTAVNSAYKRTLELFEKHDCASMLESIPEIYEENPWSKYNFLQFVQDHLSIADEANNEAIEISKQLVGLLNPLKITLETIAEEPLPLCSLMKPLSRKLTEEYFHSFLCETEALSDVKDAVTKELEHRILNNMFLSEASFIDPRFQGVIVENESLQEIKESIAQRFEHVLANHIAEEKPVKVEVPTTQRKSSLKLFFNRGSEQETKPVQNSMKRSLDYEIMKYTAETVVDLEQCPMKWWEENEFIFRKLRKISDYYICVPCCMPNFFKYSFDDRIAVTNRRFMLRKSIADQMWFLHFNKEMLEKLKVGESIKK